MQEFISRPPPYAILSHTWGKGEVSIQDFHSLPLREKKQGFSKIKATCQQARNQGLDYAWVDTCCIDKTSSSDLGEAINSMFKWYRDSAVCYAFLEDIPSEDSTPDETTRNTTTLGFGHSRWFTRGWTLQELIAPSRVEFYNRSWQQIGGKKELATSLATATGIDAFILDGTGDLGQVSVGRRMSWAVDRETAREEDIAYSLLGIFNVNMALIYGEGARAFLRLQEKILQHSDDHTIFAWRGSPLSVNREEARGLFATSPNEFRNFLAHSCVTTKSIYSHPTPRDNLARVWGSKMPQDHITMTNKGIRITSKIMDVRYPWAPRDLIILILNCYFNGDPTTAAGIFLKRQGENHYVRIRATELPTVHPGASHTVASMYGLGSIADLRHHHYDEQWTNSTRIMGEMSEAKRLGEEEMSVRKGYQHAFYLPRGYFKVYGLLGSFYLDRIWTTDAQGLWRSFLFDPRDHVGDLVLKGHSKFKAALVFTSGSGKECVFILLEMQFSEAGREHHFDAICLSVARAAELHSRFVREGIDADTLLGTNRPKVSGRVVDIQVSQDVSRLRVKIAPTTLCGISMQRIRISRASVPSDTVRFLCKGPAIIVYLTGILCWIYVSVSSGEKGDQDTEWFRRP